MSSKSDSPGRLLRALVAPHDSQAYYLTGDMPDLSMTYSETILLTRYLLNGMMISGPKTHFDLPAFEGHFRGGKAVQTVDAKKTFQMNLVQSYLMQQQIAKEEGIKYEGVDHSIMIGRAVRNATYDTVVMHGLLSGHDVPLIDQEKSDPWWDALSQKAGFASFRDTQLILQMYQWSKKPSYRAMAEDITRAFSSGDYESNFGRAFITLYDGIQRKNLVKDIKQLWNNKVHLDQSDEFQKFHSNPPSLFMP